MSRVIKGILGSVLFVLLASVVSAQMQAEKKTSTRQVKFEIISVNGNTIVWKDDQGKTREFKAPAGFTAMVDGKQVGVSDLQPGTNGVATVTTTTTMTPVVVTEVRNGQVMARAGNAVIVRMADGTMRQFTAVDVEKRNAVITKDGQPIQLSQLRVGDNMSATIVTEHEPKIVTQNQVDAMGKTAAKPAPAPMAAAPAPAPAAEPAPAPAPAKKLPKTGSEMPLVALIGLLSVAVGTGLTTVRRARLVR